MASLLLCILVVLSFYGHTSAQTTAPTVTQTVHFTYGDTVRTYYLRVPNLADSTRRLPLVIDLHGYTNSAIGQSQMSGFRRRADADTFAVAWPQGVGNSWNSGGTCCGTSRARDLDDVAFLKTVVRHIRAAYANAIDGSRVYATGHSNGGAMVERLALEAGDVFAAVVDFSGLVDPGAATWAEPGKLPARLHIHGLQDSTVPFAGDTNRISADSALRLWKTALACEGEPDTLLLDTATHSLCLNYSECADEMRLGLCAIAGDHMIYSNTPRIDLTIMAWDFLRQFALQNPEEVTGLGRSKVVHRKSYFGDVNRHDAAGRIKRSRSIGHPHSSGQFLVKP